MNCTSADWPLTTYLTQTPSAIGRQPLCRPGGCHTAVGTLPSLPALAERLPKRGLPTRRRPWQSAVETFTPHQGHMCVYAHLCIVREDGVLCSQTGCLYSYYNCRVDARRSTPLQQSCIMALETTRRRWGKVPRDMRSMVVRHG